MRQVPSGVVLLLPGWQKRGIANCSTATGKAIGYSTSEAVQMIRTGDSVGYEGAVFALQEQAGLSVHPGATTALALLGKAHYLEWDTK